MSVVDSDGILNMENAANNDWEHIHIHSEEQIPTAYHKLINIQMNMMKNSNCEQKMVQKWEWLVMKNFHLLGKDLEGIKRIKKIIDSA
ncbi:hypothetical protein ACJX0J_013803, partial [Zea mays]